MDLAKSRLLGPVPRAVFAVVEHREGTVSIEMQRTEEDGTEQLYRFQCQTNGEPTTNLVQGVEVITTAHWAASELEIVSRMMAGGRERTFRDYWQVSADGATLTMEHRSDELAGQVAVFQRK